MMRRHRNSMRTRHLFQSLIALSCVLSVAPASAQSRVTLENGFRSPPIEAKPRTLWMWMNGNVSSNGITRDLEAMKQAGLGCALIFNIGEFIPKGGVDYGKAEWLGLMVHAAKESDRLGLELAMHNCPGWSSSGGPWITPEMSMQRLVWSETRIRGGTNLTLQLPQPFTRLNYYRDVAVLAFPSLPGEEQPFADSIHAIRQRGQSIDKQRLTDADLATTVQASPDNPIVLEFENPFSARAVTIWYAAGGSTIGFNLEASDDGENFRPVIRLTPVTPRAIEDASHTESFEPVQAKFFRVTPNRSRAVCEIELHRAARIPGWNYKANYSYRAALNEGVPTPVERGFAIDSAKVVDLTSAMDERGRLQWNAPEGNWTIVRFGHTPRGQENIAAPDAGIGLECDKMSRTATAYHFEHGLGPLMKALGPLAGKSFKELEVDSYEVGVQNWTAGFEKNFRARTGYRMGPYLLAMTGRYVGSAEQSERFLWDLRRTHAEMVAECYYAELRDLAQKHGLRLLAEPYGAGPGAYDELQIGRTVDVPMGEFWAHFPWDDMMSIRLAASAAHVNGKKIVAGEAFTSTEEQSRFMDHPFGLKATGDLAFSLGLNRMYFHRFAHQPHPTATPGMTMGPWGFNFDRNNTWFDQSRGWLEYLARCQFMLQQGTFVADVLYFTGEGSPRASKKIVPEIPGNFQFDAIDAEVLIKQARVEQGRIQLNDGGSYRLLVLPPDLKSMTPATLRKLHELVHAGATLLGSRPQYSPTLTASAADEKAFEAMADELWRDASANTPARVGRGQVFTELKIGQVLTRMNTIPDFEFLATRGDAALVWLHRRTKDAEIYFVANRQRREEEVLCQFRVVGLQPEIWRPETGTIERPAVFEFSRSRTRLPLKLKPAESVFIVFRSPAMKGVASIVRDGKPVTMTNPQVFRERSAAGVIQATNSFTISAWIRPDTDLMSMPQEGGNVAENGKSWVLPALEGDRHFGSNSAGVGVAAGRNGVIVAERISNRLTAALVSRTSISGWTHLAVVCDDGKPKLYLNGKLDREGKVFSFVPHVGMGVTATSRTPIYYFDGEVADVKVAQMAMSAAEIETNASRGLPEPEVEQGVELVWSANGKLAANVWETGRFSLDDGRGWEITELPVPQVLAGEWNVTLNSKLSPEKTLTLTNLISLQRHADPEVRHFAGTVVYRTQFELAGTSMGNGKRLWLDLGRLSALAEVRLNGKLFGNLWTIPFRVEITDAVQPGRNELEVRVTTLLANRMIGDELLPPENEYDSKTRAIKKLPDWYSSGASKPPGGRTTFSTWKFFSADEPLLEAGLIGPVRILTSVSVELN